MLRLVSMVILLILVSSVEVPEKLAADARPGCSARVPIPIH